MQIRVPKENWRKTPATLLSHLKNGAETRVVRL